MIQPSTRSRRSALAVVAVLAVGVSAAACGGEESTGPVADPDTTVEAVDTLPLADEPVSTLDPDLPGRYEGGIAPVDVTGDPLSPLIGDAGDPSIGQPVPALSGFDLEGRPIKIDPAVDGPTMLVFLAHWCQFCNAEVPVFNRMRAFGQIPEELNVVGIATAPDPNRPNWPPDEWLAELDWKYPTMTDGLNADETTIAGVAYGVTGFPTVVLVDADGNLASRWSGQREPEQIIASIAAMNLG